ncbi:hypothetical protein [Enterococcus sp. AZ072]|uniref:hypothetical protein n=1 Tax=unclassified Enterococcus TaxID=2608891 RepID=UPI003D296229
MKKEVKSGDFFSLAMLAFGGVGLELLLLFLESLVYSNSLNEMTTTQHILHWCLTSFVWGACTLLLARYAKNHYSFDITGSRKSIKTSKLIVAILLVLVCIASNAWSWGTLKILGELAKKESIALFLFQYIYYIFEVGLILSIIAYGQKAGELRFGKVNIPWGGFIVGLSWGLMHALTKGSLFIGAEAMITGILYGSIYLLVEKRGWYSYCLILLAFVL